MPALAPRALSRAPAGPSVTAGVVSDGRHRAVLDANGRGFSAAGPLLLTPFFPARDDRPGGLRLYLRDLASGRWWPLGGTMQEPSADDLPPRLWNEVGVVTLHQRTDDLTASLQVWVDPARSIELRRLVLRNHAHRPRTIELTSFVEVALQQAAAHAAHPLFSKLFLQTEWREGLPTDPSAGILLARRRPREKDESFPSLAHALLGAPVRQHESDRAAFLGRGRPADRPRAMTTSHALSGAVGNVLDPALCLRADLELEPGEARSVTFALGVDQHETRLVDSLDELTAESAIERSRDSAVAQEQERRRELGLEDALARRLQEIHVGLLGGEPGLRGRPVVVESARGSAGRLAHWGLEAHRPLVLVPAEGDDEEELVQSALRAQRYWHSLGLAGQMAVVASTGMSHELAAAVEEDVGIHVIDAGAVTPADLELLEALAGWVHDGPELPDLPLATARAGAARLESAPPEPAERESAEEPPPLRFAIEHGGFTEDGAEYRIRLERQDDGSWTRPPRPWVNLLANERFGLICSESGACSPFGANSREQRIGPWSNDAVLDPHGNALLIRDEDAGTFWSPLPGPTPSGRLYEMVHGFGYSRCHHRSHGLEQETTLWVDRRDPVRVLRLRLRNESRRPRRLSIFEYQQLVLGPDDTWSPRTVVTHVDDERTLLTATNRLAGWGGVCFASAAADRPLQRWSASSDRRAFLGPGGSPSAPRALLEDEDLDGREGGGLDPCFVQQLVVDLPTDETVELCFVLGEATDPDHAHQLARRHADVESAANDLEEVTAFWRERLGRLRIATPSPGLDILVNGWLVYQTVACRLWARSAFYQSGGAYGFRDQLQDALALVDLWPELARDQILLHAAHQLVEGDVLHWWHPPDDRGLRTRFADDLLWLPHLTAHYLRVTGDHALLDEHRPFLCAPLLEEGEAERFVQAEPSGESASIFDHGCRAIDRSLAVGAHGLPLFGCGDWNDGMNRVGAEGRGESVWMGFFLHTVLGEWAPLCEQRGDTERAARYRSHRAALGEALEAQAWDGHWYRRGYYDDGSPLGSAESDECRIDALVQAWCVMSGAAPSDRAREAMRSVAEHLVDEEEGLIRLLTPPFVETPHDPGYIRGYVAGVRENGGQYTHAALWVVRAFAELGERDRALRLLERLGPVHHARDDEGAQRYGVEPYVVAADVYGAPPHVGRGGWTWYTGSAGWMLRVVLESVLGLRIDEGRWLVVEPRVPDHWEGFHVRWRPLGGPSSYDVEVRNPDRRAETVVELLLDGRPVRPVDGRGRVPLERDGETHRLEVVLGRAEHPASAARAAGETA